jgi:hypothetical protein
MEGQGLGWGQCTRVLGVESSPSSPVAGLLTQLDTCRFWSAFCYTVLPFSMRFRVPTSLLLCGSLRICTTLHFSPVDPFVICISSALVSISAWRNLAWFPSSLHTTASDTSAYCNKSLLSLVWRLVLQLITCSRYTAQLSHILAWSSMTSGLPHVMCCRSLISAHYILARNSVASGLQLATFLVTGVTLDAERK